MDRSTVSEKNRVSVSAVKSRSKASNSGLTSSGITPAAWKAPVGGISTTTFATISCRKVEVMAM